MKTSLLLITVFLFSLTAMGQTYQKTSGNIELTGYVKFDRSPLSLVDATAATGLVTLRQLNAAKYVKGTPWTAMGYITKLTSGQVEAALGYTPLNTLHADIAYSFRKDTVSLLDIFKAWDTAPASPTAPGKKGEWRSTPTARYECYEDNKWNKYIPSQW